MSTSKLSLWTPIPGGVTAPEGFSASGIAAGLKPSGNLDLALILAPEGSICAGAFTQSIVRASCVDLSRDRLKSTFGKVRAVLINSGQANACTGERGLLDTLSASSKLADLLGLKNDQVVMCSTGVIGEPIAMPNLLSGLEKLVASLNDEDGTNAANAILTTDLVTKQIAFERILGDTKVKVGGMAKGSGMIHPDMATMLGFLTCNIGVPYPIWSEMVKEAVNNSFNSITVDGDTSTNDTFLAFSAGPPLHTKYFDLLQDGLNMVTQSLAKSIVRDGEGSNCLIEVQVDDAHDSASALKMARTICSSSLVKTAVHGSDPNWGRILAAAGRSEVSFDPDQISLWIGSHQLIQNGFPIDFDRDQVSIYMKSKLQNISDQNNTLLIRLSLGNGVSQGVAWGCDLSEEYVRINADYTT
ncbi:MULTISPECIES: bifunctional glutamate N-acetyltransferase/amino-acid acetyltransferase ArgJ [Prochlorococcus]|uniref:bifunctional glutamate N-acetyltransferase/amino-acid acetyltransferase ArgJ n=1 Tax=Prochlorococcus TaxID=1218 RepID=UPI0005339F2E|nr:MULTISPECIES: bifunctional glutamate N-acetyltransferase/amino-acid acetyltransferase ArgJ [Prochlorococcus]KGG13337.1 Glutamate N-acetyltransferase [Prochlorococcus sp. MIT 0601]